jgi:hypothetical protein
VSVAVGVGVIVGVGVAVGVGELVGVAVGVGVREAVGVAVSARVAGGRVGGMGVGVREAVGGTGVAGGNDGSTIRLTASRKIMLPGAERL